MLLQQQKVFSIKHYHWKYTVKWKEHGYKTHAIPQVYRMHRSREQPQKESDRLVSYPTDVNVTLRQCFVLGY